jgi:uncharacterized protein YjdB
MKKTFTALLCVIMMLTTFITPVYASPGSTNNTIAVEKAVENNPTDSTKFEVILLKDGNEYDRGIISHGETVNFGNLPAGDYTLKETPVEGYKLVSINPDSVRVRGKNNSYKMTVTNRLIVEDPPAPIVSVTGVSLDTNTLTLRVGESYTLIAAVLPENAANKEVTWSSSDASVAAVDANGTVTAISSGTAAITVTSVDGNYTAKCDVTVETPEPQIISVTGVSLDIGALTLKVGETRTLIAAVLPENATNKAVTWSSSDTSIAAVDANGTVTAMSSGTAAITVTTVDGEYRAACNVTVTSSIHYVALGDSLATGTTSRGTTTSYVHGFFNNIRTLYPYATVTMSNLSNDGDKSSHLLSKLRNNATFRTEVSKADIITISIGGNNIMDAGRSSYFSRIDHSIAEAGTRDFEAEYNLIIEEIRSLNGDAKIVAMTLYNPFNTVSISGYSGDPQLHKDIDPYIRRINAQVNAIQDNNYRVADVYSYFLTNYANKGKMGDVTYFYPTSLFKLTRDPHPNQKGQNEMTTIHNDVFKSFN